MADQWYYRLFGTEFGPVSRSALDSLIQSSQLNHNDEIRAEGAPAWGRVRDLFAPQTGATSANGPNTPTESLSASTPASAEQWFYQTLGHDFGPIAFHELVQLVRQGEVGAEDLVRTSSTAKWRRAGSIGRLMTEMPFQAQKAANPAPVQTPAAASSDDDELEFNLPQSNHAAAVDNRARSTAPSATAASAADATWYAWVGGKEYGPVELTHLMEWAKQGRISSRDYIRHGKNSQWTVVSSVPGLVPAAVGETVAAPQTATAVAQSSQSAATVPAATPAKHTPASVATVGAAAPATAAKSSATAAIASGTPVVPASAPATPVAPSATPEAAPDSALKATETGMSSMTSFSGSSSVASTFSRASQPTKKWTPPGKKGKGSGGKFSANVSLGILKDIRFQGAVGGILLIIGLYVGWKFLPEGTGKFKEPFQQLTAIYKEVETKAGSSPSEGDWKEFGQETEPKIKAVKDKLSEMKKSQHLVKGKLNSLAGQLIMLLRKKPDEVENSLKAAKRLQGEAAKMLGVSP